MPKIPTYDSKAQLTPKTITTEVPGIPRSPQEAAISGKSLTYTGKLLSEIGEQFRLAKSTQQYMEGSNLAKAQIREVVFNAEGDTGMELSEKYLPQIEKIKSEASKNMRYPDARKKLDENFAGWSLNAEYLIRGIERRNIIDKGEATFQESISSTKTLFYEAATPEEKKRIKDIEIPSLIKTAVDSKYITAVQGVLLEQKIDKELPEGQALFDVQVNPTLAYEKLTNEEYGLKEIDPVRWADLKNVAKTAVENLEKEADKTREGQYYSELNEDPEVARAKLINGQYGIKDTNSKLWHTLKSKADTDITKIKARKLAEAKVAQAEKENVAENEILKMIYDKVPAKDILYKTYLYDATRTIGEVDKDFPANIKALLESRKAVAPEVEAKTFNRLQDDFVALGIKVQTVKGKKRFSTKASFEDMAKFRANVIGAWTDGKIIPEVARNWLEGVSHTFEKALDIATEKRLGEDNPKTLWQKLSVWSDEYAEDREETKARLGNEFMERFLNSEESGEDITDDLIEKEQKRSNPSRALYKLGEKITTPGGIVEVVGFDGDGEPLIKLVK